MAQNIENVKYIDGQTKTDTHTATQSKPYTIKDIEALTQSDAERLALEVLTVKGHTVYLVDFGGYFGYSALVFADGQHISYANDYALHHRGMTAVELRALYLQRFARCLFTETELAAPTSDPDEIDRRRYYLQNYYGMRRPHVSVFGVFRTEADEKARAIAIQGKHFNPVCYAYYDDAAFVRKCVALSDAIEKAAAANKDNFGYWKDAFLKEMINHEYAINWQADYDTISAFANVSGVLDYENREELFRAANFTDLQRRAYDAARSEYYRSHADF